MNVKSHGHSCVFCHNFRQCAEGVIYENIVWFYKDPVRESSKIDDYLCFYNEKVDRISVDHVSEIKGNSK